MRDYSKIEAPEEPEIYSYNRGDPQISYRGKLYNYYDVEDWAWDDFKDEYGVDESRYSPDPMAFNKKDYKYSRKVDDAFDEYFRKNMKRYLDEMIANEWQITED